jgi:hypothetical protein
MSGFHSDLMVLMIQFLGNDTVKMGHIATVVATVTVAIFKGKSLPHGPWLFLLCMSTI